MGDEASRVEQWLYSTLSGDAALTVLVGTRIYSETAPPSTSSPLLVYSMQSAHDVAGASAQRIMIDGLWLIKAVTTGASYSPLTPIMDRVDALLHRSDGGTAGTAIVFTSVREYPVRYHEITDGVGYRHLGGVYRIWAQIPD